jgi:hypothetical protein
MKIKDVVALILVNLKKKKDISKNRSFEIKLFKFLKISQVLDKSTVSR